MASEIKREAASSSTALVKDNNIPLWKRPRTFDNPESDVTLYRQSCGLDYFENWDPTTARLYSSEAENATKKAKQLEKKLNKKKIIDDDPEDADVASVEDKEESTTIPPYVQPDRSNADFKIEHDNGPYIFVKAKRFGSNDLEDISIRGPFMLVGYSVLGCGNWKGGYPVGSSKIPSFPVETREKADISVCINRNKAAYLSFKPHGAEMWDEFERYDSWLKDVHNTLKSKVMDSQTSIFIETARSELCKKFIADAGKARKAAMEALQREKGMPGADIHSDVFKQTEKKIIADHKIAQNITPTRRQVFELFEKAFTCDDRDIKGDKSSLMKLAHKLYRWPKKQEKDQPAFEGFLTPVGRDLACRSLPAVIMGGVDAKAAMLEKGMIADYPKWYMLSDPYPKSHPWMNQKLATGSICAFKTTIKIRQSHEHLKWRQWYDVTEFHFYQYPPPPSSMDPSLLMIEHEPENAPPPRIKFSGAHPIGGPTAGLPMLEYHPPASSSVIVHTEVLNNKRKSDSPPHHPSGGDNDEEEEDNDEDIPCGQLSPISQAKRLRK